MAATTGSLGPTLKPSYGSRQQASSGLRSMAARHLVPSRTRSAVRRTIVKQRLLTARRIRGAAPRRLVGASRLITLPARAPL